MKFKREIKKIWKKKIRKVKKNDIMYNYYFILINTSINIIKNININSSFQIKYYIFIIKEYKIKLINSYFKNRYKFVKK